jgi:plasmid stabilization system protein ParE
MTVRFTPRARADLDAILGYLDQKHPKGAANVARTIRKTFDLIAQFPHAGRLAGEQGTRVLPAGHYPYLIYWDVEGGEARIVHIRHAALRPWEPDRLSQE